MVRRTILISTMLAVLLVGGCGYFRGAKDVQTDVGGAEGLSDGPGIMTGKRGGVIIYQK